ncbi:MAG: phosphoribosylaminoimidazolesuccinocarboxamide synthase [Deltaproteobacteria bacterium CG03_land_8_20_14_0_80_45_14]|nr:MAG: phosphoribosylaminoimidazolesuccinocarboxamide synthase [Deltaproteobacteria bacterium CG03_land_8_20_14_0_80_45_14]
MTSQVVSNTDFKNLKLKGRGKVRDIYDLGDQLLIVATDRMSAFDVVMPNPIPDKGRILTQLSKFWFDLTKDIVPNHVLSTKVEDYPKDCQPYQEMLRDRSMLVTKTEVLPVECVVRGYLSGSGWEEYRKTGEVCGIRLPEGLVESSKLDEPILTPATKAEMGLHDENISFEKMEKIVGKELGQRLKTLSIAIYEKAGGIAEKKGIIIADTKMEFGIKDGKLILIDELLTPDSSRFWPKDEYQPGGPQKSFDKQFLRDYLLSIRWDKSPPAPQLPEEIVRKTREKYLEAYEKLVGRPL